MAKILLFLLCIKQVSRYSFEVYVIVNQSNPLICIFTGLSVNSYSENYIDQFTENLIFSVNH